MDFNALDIFSWNTEHTPHSRMWKYTNGKLSIYNTINCLVYFLYMYLNLAKAFLVNVFVSEGTRENVCWVWFICFSTVSSSINALVAVTLEDFVKPVLPNLTEKQVSWMNMGLSKC